jgi:AcrR family transcriptional regulator
MSQRPENLRVRRTRKLLRAALIELIEERGFDQLTVGEITARAMISRAAFYRNYNDKFHLVEQIFDEAIGALIGTMSDDERPVEERWVSFFEHISEYHRLYGALLGKSGSPWFANRMRGTLATMAKQHLTDTPEAVALSTQPPRHRAGAHPDIGDVRPDHHLVAGERPALAPTPDRRPVREARLGHHHGGDQLVTPDRTSMRVPIWSGSTRSRRRAPTTRDPNSHTD